MRNFYFFYQPKYGQAFEAEGVEAVIAEDLRLHRQAHSYAVSPPGALFTRLENKPPVKRYYDYSGKGVPPGQWVLVGKAFPMSREKAERAYGEELVAGEIERANERANQCA